MQQGTFSLFNSAFGGWWVKCPPPFTCIPARSNEGVLGINIFESVCLHDKVIPKGIPVMVEGGFVGYITVADAGIEMGGFQIVGAGLR